MRNLRHQPQKWKTGDLATFLACGPVIEVSICAVKWTQDSLCWHLPSVLWKVPLPLAQAATIGADGHYWRLPCESLYTGHEILKYSLGCNIWINLMIIGRSGFKSFSQLSVPWIPEKIPKDLNPHDKQRCNICLSWPQHAVKVILCGKGPVLFLEYLQMLWDKLGTTIPLGLFVAQHRFTDLGVWHLGYWDPPGTGAIEQWVLKTFCHRVAPSSVSETGNI